jgi:hypothetical protein
LHGYRLDEKERFSPGSGLIQWVNPRDLVELEPRRPPVDDGTETDGMT